MKTTGGKGVSSRLMAGKIIISLLFLLSFNVYSGVGESAVITLIFPYGARSCGMGEVGTALADDESALFFNPAGLGVHNSRWSGGAASHFFELLLPELDVKDLWHRAFSGYIQPPLRSNIGGFGVYSNYINMGVNPISDAMGRTRFKSHSWEGVMAIGWGFNLAELGDSSRYYGIAVKPFISALAPGLGSNGEGTAQGFAIDIGLLRLFGNGLRFGFTMMNMGPDIFYVNEAYRDPLPFTVNLALGYKKSIIYEHVRLADVSAEMRLNKELVVNHFNGDPDPFFKAMFTDLFNEPLDYEIQEINVHTGFEVGILNTVFYRHGFMFDYVGERYEMVMGAGIRLFRHIDADCSIIYSPEGFLKPLLKQINRSKDGATGVRHLQWRLNLSITRLGKYKKSDLAWWEE